MITISFEKRGTMGLCEFLSKNLKEQIANGTLCSGIKMPSKRSLAQNLGVSVITVQNAYANLISEGYLFSVEKKGFFVSDYFPKQNEKARPLPLNVQKEQKVDFFTDFKNNATSFQKFPFTLWSRLMRRVLSSENENLLCSSGKKGIFSLRNAISLHLKEFRNMNVDAEQIILGSGTENLYTLLFELLGQNTLFALENPGYHKIAEVCKINASTFVPIEMDSCGIKIDALKKSGATVVHVSPSHHFPTGIVFPYSRRHELLLWVKEKNHYIIEDDYDSEFRFNGKPLASLFESDSSDSVIYVNTFSKTLAPSFRIGYMILPKRLLLAFEKQFASYSCQVSAFEQYTLDLFIREGHYSKHIIRMKNYYRTLRDVLIHTLESSLLSEIFQIKEEEAGLHFLLKIKNDDLIEKSSCIQKAFLDYGINLPLISDYFYGSVPAEYKGTFVVNYSGIKKERIAETVFRMECAVQKALCGR